MGGISETAKASTDSKKWLDAFRSFRDRWPSKLRKEWNDWNLHHQVKSGIASESLRVSISGQAKGRDSCQRGWRVKLFTALLANKA